MLVVLNYFFENWFLRYYSKFINEVLFLIGFFICILILIDVVEEKVSEFDVWFFIFMVEVDFCGYVIFVFVYLMFKLGLVLGFYVFFYIFKVMLKVNMVMGSDGNNEW